MSTGAFIAYHASARPDAVALVARGREITYDQFHRDLGRFVRAVADLGLPRGSSVAIAWGELYPHWLLLIACEELGIATATFALNEIEPGARLLETVDLVLSETRPPQVESARYLPLTERWLADVFARPDVGMPAALAEAPDDPLRIVRTSGTTGVPKLLLLRRHMVEATVTRLAWVMELTRTSRSVVNAQFTANGSYALATAMLRAGGTMIDPGAAAALADPARPITHLRVMPQELKVILDGLPRNFVKPAELTLVTVGAAVAASLRERALRLLASEVIVSYASNEMPFVAITREGGSESAKTVYPWVEIEIVDERDLPLPVGEIGRIRMREPEMATGYMDDPETTARKFRDGWFYPGDLGILHGPRRLQVIGREDEVLNIGGRKIAPSALEAHVLRHATVGDIGVCTLANAEGIEEICVAVAHPAHDDAELMARVTRAFRDNPVGRFFVMPLPRIPRNANGKIDRKRLKEMAAVAVLQARGRAAGREQD